MHSPRFCKWQFIYWFDGNWGLIIVIGEREGEGREGDTGDFLR